jgi:peptidyl-prolyl cis-trans isomerase C
MCRRLIFTLWTVLILFLFCGSRGAWSQEAPTPQAESQTKPEDRVVITVDNDKMTAGEVEQFIASLPPQYRTFYSGPAKPLLPQYLVKMKIMVAMAEKENLADQPEIKEAVKIARDSILANAAQRRMEQNMTVTDQELQDLYQKRKGEFEEVHIRHILLRTHSTTVVTGAAPNRPALPDEEARKKLEDIREKILAGADFGQLAQQYSDDLETAGSGGDMGYVDRQKVPSAIADVAYALPPGHVSDVIKTPYGLELIKVEDRRVRPFAEVKPGLEAQLRKTKAEEAIKDLISKHKVDVDERFFAAKPLPGTEISPGLH